MDTPILSIGRALLHSTRFDDSLDAFATRDVSVLGDKVPYMSDVDHDTLYRQAESQAGYFTAGQALEAGMDRSTLRHHARPGGRYRRVGRGLYRLRHFPSSPYEHVMAAWLPLRSGGAVVSHESALELHDLSDVIPEAVHLTVPRSERGTRPRAGVRLHTSEDSPTGNEVSRVGGLPVTSVERSILDSFESGAQPEQIELAIHQALERGLTTPSRLRRSAARRPKRVQQFVEHTEEGAAA
jgi:predicted transcriptional regulator of viral defense system